MFSYNLYQRTDYRRLQLMKCIKTLYIKKYKLRKAYSLPIPKQDKILEHIPLIWNTKHTLIKCKLHIASSDFYIDDNLI